MVAKVLNNVCLCGSGERGARRNYYTGMSETTPFTFIYDKLGVLIKKSLASFVSSGKNNLFQESLLTVSIPYFTQQHSTLYKTFGFCLDYICLDYGSTSILMGCGILRLTVHEQ